MHTDWAKAAAKLAAHWCNRPWHPAVLAWLESNPHGPLGLACSGGADSLTLLLLAHVRLGHRMPIVVLHFNHGLRGGESDADAAFVSAAAHALGCTYLEGAPAVPLQDANEADLRTARLCFFRSSGCRAILQGHLLSDVAETQLMRLGRGSGCEGLAAPRPVSDDGSGPVFLRPLLERGKAEVIEGLRSLNIHWREDASNRSRVHYRNRIRHEVLPALIGQSPGDYLQGCGRSRMLAGEAADAIRQYADALLEDATAALALDRLRRVPRAVTRVVLHRWLNAQGLAHIFSANAFDGILDRLRNPAPFRLSAGAGMYVASDGQHLIRTPCQSAPPPAWQVLALTPGQTIHWPGGATLTATTCRLSTQLRNKITGGAYTPDKDAFLNWDGTPSPVFHVRPWRAGDRYRPLGAPGSRKLHDQWVDRKVPLRERKRLMVVCDNKDQPLWVPGLPCADDWKLTDKSKWALRLTYRPFC